MNATLNRLLLLVHGQGDELDNPPKRHFWPATVDADGKPTPTCFCAHVRGGCRQGRACPLRETELAIEEAPSDAPFSGKTAAEKRAERERSRNRRRANWLAIAQALVGLIGFAATLALLAPKN